MPLSISEIERAVLFLLQTLKVATHEVAFHFVTESEICKLHKDFFKDPSPTDCITFPMDPPEARELPYHVLGEAFICPKVAKEYARKQKIDPHAELMRYVTHCMLHLVGYRDTEPKERARMKRKENSCLQKMLEYLAKN